MKSLQLTCHFAASASAHPNRLRALSKLRAQQSSWKSLGGVDGAATLVASREGALKALAALFSLDRKPGDCFLFYGDVGVGKSTFSRAYIRSAAEDPFLQVPSPTFLLKNTYELEGSPALNHFDLFRLGEAADWSRLQLQESFQSGVSLVEWAERLQQPLPTSYLAIHLRILNQVPDWMLQQEQKAQRQHSLADPEYAMAELHGGLRGELEEDEDEEEGHGYQFVDRSWRVLRLQPMGERWQRRVEEVKGVVRHGGVQGLLLVEDGEAGDTLLPSIEPYANRSSIW